MNTRTSSRLRTGGRFPEKRHVSERSAGTREKSITLNDRQEMENPARFRKIATDLKNGIDQEDQLIPEKWHDSENQLIPEKRHDSEKIN